MEDAAATNNRRIDAHVHILGNGSSGSGCWIRLPGRYRYFAPLALRHIGLNKDCLKGDLDNLYAERLLQQIRESSLDAAIVLAQDDVHDENGKVIEKAGVHYVPNDYVLSLAEKYPEFLPCISIHPARADAFEELERCLENGALMMKLLPNCQNINCSDQKYRPFWERMAEAGLPLLSHTGGEHTLPIINHGYADPRILELPLQCGVTVIAGHSATKSGLGDRNYLDVLIQMMERYPNLYGDNSAFNTPLRSQYIKDTLQEPLANRMIHGSDYPVAVHGHWAWKRGFVGYRIMKKWQKQPNVIERDYQLKVAVGYSQETFTRVNKLLRH